MKKPHWVWLFGTQWRVGSPAWKWAEKNKAKILGVLGRHKHRKPKPAPAPAPKPAPSPQPVKGCDYVSGPSVAALKNAGIKFVFRYLSTPGNPKNLTVAEAKKLHAAGIKIGLVFETTGTTFKGGAPAGRHDATAALQQAKALGVPDTVPIYFAIDTDPSGRTQLVVDYIKGCAAVLTKERTGVYGGLAAIDACASAGACAWFWQTLAWSGGVWSPHAHVEQYANGQKIGTATVDLDRAVRQPYGVW